MNKPKSKIQPWYQRAIRWGQTNITEIDPTRYDIAWWRTYWKRTRVQGVIVNAGGIIAYYPTGNPLHRRSQYLDNSDTFGDVLTAAREEGLAVLARMDCNRADEKFYRTHPDWFTHDASGQPFRAGELYLSCINSPYYTEYIPGILREIADRYHPEGFADNSWSGIDRGKICYCSHCVDVFRDSYGMELPKKHDWADRVFRAWIRWNYRRRLELWDHYNRVAAEAGGPDCRWLGMISGDLGGQCWSFRDIKAIAERAPMLLIDSQMRNNSAGFHANADSGKLLHGVAGWEKLMPESMAMYQGPEPTFRLCARPVPEAHLWMAEGFAGGIQPWWHHISAYHEDRRQYRTAAPLLRWHQANQRYLVGRKPLASVGIVWSQENGDFFGKDDIDASVVQPYRGWVQALVRARIPYVPVHADAIGKHSNELSALILPNVGILTESQCQAIRAFAGQGKGVIASGETGLYNEDGERNPEFALGDLFRVQSARGEQGTAGSLNPSWDRYEHHSYMRLHPELRGTIDGPKTGTEPSGDHGRRHEILAGFEETDILPCGGRIEAVAPGENAEVPLTFIPSFPIYPPETAWMREPRTSVPMVVVSTTPAGARIVYCAADLDRCFFRYNLPDHGNLLENIVRWATKGKSPLSVEGRGFIDCNLYTQPGRVIVHIINLTNASTWRSPVHEFIPIGPLRVSVQLPDDVSGKSVRATVSGRNLKSIKKRRMITVTIPSVECHELLVIE
jgi:hypothetical protein